MFNFIKTTALVAAVGAGTTASADAWFGLQSQVESDSSIVLDLIRTDEAGMVAIYDFTGGEFGEVLGMADLNAGANADVIVPLEASNAQTVAAVIYQGEMTEPTMAANWMELEVSDDS